MLVSNQSFTATVGLPEGVNEITAIQTDAATNILPLILVMPSCAVGLRDAIFILRKLKFSDL